MTDATRQLLVALAHYPCVQDQDAGACALLFADVLQRNSLYQNIVAATANGDVSCSVGAPDATVNVAGHLAFRRAVETKGFASGEYAISPITGRPTLSFAHAAVDAAGTVRAVVVATIELDWLCEIMDGAGLPAGSTLSAIDQSGAVLAHWPEAEAWLAKPPPAAMQPIVAHGEGLHEGAGPDGAPRLYAFTRLDDAGTGARYVCVGIPMGAVVAEANRTLARSVTALGAAALLALTVAWGAGQRFILGPVQALLDMIRRFEAGDLQARVGPGAGAGEMGRVAQALDQMAATVEGREPELRRFGARTEALRSELLRHLITAQEEERKRIARELHDETSQGLSALIVSLETIGMEIGRTSRPLQTARSVAVSLLEGIRRLIGDLRPALLDDLGLVPAIAWFAEQRLQAMGIEVDLQCSLPDETRLPPALETALFRISQEAINNIARHAGATRVAIGLRVAEDRAVLSVEDNGRGFEPACDVTQAAQGPCLGLRGIRERASILGGEFRLRTAPGQGVKLEVQVPFLMEETDDGKDATLAR